jgi:hypothetical protein
MMNEEMFCQRPAEILKLLGNDSHIKVMTIDEIQ